MTPDSALITLGNNVAQIKEMLTELVLLPRRDLVKWAKITKQTPNVKIGYPAQHLASLVTGVEGERTGARGNDLRDKSEVKSCSRVDQLDKCNECKAAVARIETFCPKCESTKIKRNNDSKWLIGVRSEEELEFLINDVPRLVFIISDYPNYNSSDWETLRFQVFEIWPGHERHDNFRILMENYYYNIYLSHIDKNPNKTPAPKNFWPESFQFYMCNPILIFHCIVDNALSSPQFGELQYVEPSTDRATINPVNMPMSLLRREEKSLLRRELGDDAYSVVERNGLDVGQRLFLDLRDTDHATPQSGLYRRGAR